VLPASLTQHPRRDAIGSVIRAALDAASPERCVARHVELDGERLVVGQRAFDLSQYGRVRVFGAGKASVGIAKALRERLGDRISDGLVITKGEGALDLGPIQVRTAGHPLPDQASLEATEELTAALATGQPDDLVLCPISGGASSLLTAPTGVSLEDLRTRTTKLLRSGEPIQSINELRRSWDRIKAGGLARAAAPATVVGLVISDVVGDPLRYIGSGPTVPDRPDERVHNCIIGRNADAIEGATQGAKAADLSVGHYRDPLVGEAREVGKRLGLLLARAEDGFPVARPGVLIAGGETTVEVRGSGVGGRNQELALAAVLPLAKGHDLVIAAFGTDGEDGPSGAAGAIVTHESARRAQEAGLDVLDHLERNDSHTFFKALGDALTTGQTGTNVCDLVLGFVF
jgi:hydroxypyruvate reductase